MYRKERDSLGSLEVLSDALYGIQTLRAFNNFNVTDKLVHKDMIISMAYVKKAAAQANKKIGELDAVLADLIISVCDEIIEGKHRKHFITKVIQGGAGTSINMNMNEVISNRVAQIKNEALGVYKVCHPNDHVNHAQSTNDVMPTSGKLTVLKLSETLIQELILLKETIKLKSLEFEDDIKVGRTHLQDAVFISMKDVFGSFATMITRDIKRIEYALEEMKYINMGATAVGTGINTHPKYKEHVVKYLNQYTGFEFESAEDMVDATKHVDSFMYVHNSLKNLAVNLSKMSNDLRLMASGPKAGLGEIILPSKQAGSSIMPGKVNPVIAEMINQVAFQVMGNDTTINMATEAGQMELNVFEPIIFENLFESFDLLTKGAISLRRDIFVDLSVNSEHIKNVGKNSLAGVTALLPVLGYDLISKYAKESLEKDIPLESLLIRDKLIDEETLKMFQDPKTMV